jgi:hypothetical protein
MTTTRRNDDLVAAMEAMTTAPSAGARTLLHAAVGTSTLLVPLTEPADETSDAPALFLAPGEDGSLVFVAFTDVEALRAWADGDQPFASVDGRTACRLVVEHGADGLVINAAGPWGGRLSQHDCELVAEGLVPTEGEEGVLARGGAESVLRLDALGEEPPRALVETLRRAADAAGASECYLADGAFGPGPTHLVAGVVLDNGGPRTDSLRAVGDAAQPALPAGQALDVVALDGDLLAAMRRVGRRIFERQSRS